MGATGKFVWNRWYGSWLSSYRKELFNCWKIVVKFNACPITKKKHEI